MDEFKIVCYNYFTQCVQHFPNQFKFFIVDNTVPVITFLTSNDPTNTRPQIRWTSSEVASFECSLDGQNYQECGNGFSGFWTGNNIPDGKHTFSVRGRDKNGNVGNPAKFEWSVGKHSSILFLILQRKKLITFLLKYLKLGYSHT